MRLQKYVACLLIVLTMPLLSQTNGTNESASEYYPYRKLKIDGEWFGCYHYRVFSEIQKDLLELDARREQVQNLKATLQASEDITEIEKNKSFKIGLAFGSAGALCITIPVIVLLIKYR